MTAAVWTALVRHELRLVARTRATPVIALLLTIITAAAAVNGARFADEQRATIDAVQAAQARTDAATAAQLDELARRGDPRPALQLAGMAWYLYQPEGAVAPAPHMDPRRPEAASSEWVGARYAVLPPQPGAALAIGQSDLHPFYTRVTIRTRPVLVHSDEIENPLNLLSGRFDLAFALTFCWPLLVMPLLYNVLAEDRDSGTLALVAAQPVPRPAVLLARLGVRTLLPVLLTIAVSLTALALADALSGSAPAATWWLWGAAVLTTGVFWAGVAALVNVCRWSAPASATVLASCWLGGVVVAPAAIGELAAFLEPVPSRVELINAVRQAGNLSPGELAALVSTYYEAHPDATRTGLSADETAMRGLAQQDEIDRRIEPLLAGYRQRAEQQQALVDRLRFLSPPLLLYDAVTELAGTTATRYHRFAEQVDQYHRAWRAYFYPLVHARATMTQAMYEAAPRFAFAEEAPGTSARRAGMLIGAVAAMASALLLVACARSRRLFQ